MLLRTVSTRRELNHLPDIRELEGYLETGFTRAEALGAAARDSARVRPGPGR